LFPGSPVDREDHEQLAGRPDQAQPAQREDQEEHQRPAEQQREDALPARQVHQAAVEVINQAGEDGQAQQPPGPRQFELDLEW
jgi:hypothetical protein